VLFAIYTWATVMFGCRFSNLTHRGILTNGPYRWTKHPAYVAKNLAWWMTSVPFVVSTTASDAFRQCALMLLFSGVYWLRARTEEAHLSRDPVYVEYSDWMARHGVFRRLGRRP
jgi:steroid 5-alpha reductase family enzyme